MTLPPRDYIAERRREISQRMEQLRADLADLDRMESALGLGIPPLDGGVEIPLAPPQATSRRRRHIEGGIKGSVMSVLVRVRPKGLTAQQILKALKEEGVDLPRTSLSPQLSRLKRDEEVTVIDGEWAATEKGMLNYVLS